MDEMIKIVTSAIILEGKLPCGCTIIVKQKREDNPSSVAGTLEFTLGDALVVYVAAPCSYPVSNKKFRRKHENQIDSLERLMIKQAKRMVK